MALQLGKNLKKLLEQAEGKLRKGNREKAAPEQGQAGEADSSEKNRLAPREKRADVRPPRVALSGPLLIALSLVLVCAVAWAFFMGLMVGRGQNPHESLPAMAGMLEGESSAEVKDEPQEESVENEQMAEAQGPSGVLPLPAASGVHAPPSGAAAKAWPDASSRTKTVQPAAKTAPAPARVVDDKQYDFVYQVAAFRTNADASKAQKAINGKRLRSTVKRSGKVYLVMANFRGTNAEMEKMLARMKSQGMGKPLQLAKTPVQPKPARQKKK